MVVKTTILKEAVNALGVMAIAGGMWNGIVGLSRQRRQDIRQARVEPLIRQICRRSDASSPNLGRVGKIEIRCLDLAHRDLWKVIREVTDVQQRGTRILAPTTPKTRGEPRLKLWAIGSTCCQMEQPRSIPMPCWRKHYARPGKAPWDGWSCAASGSWCWYGLPAGCWYSMFCTIPPRCAAPLSGKRLYL